MRSLFGFVGVLALSLMLSLGCGEDGAESGSGGTARTGGTGATGGTAPPPEGPVRVSFIGDSITEPVGTVENPANYPEHLVSLLGDDFELANFGVGGATMLRTSTIAVWGLPEFEEAKAFEPRVVTVMLGTNDTKPQHWDAAAFESDYSDMIEELQSLPSKPTVLLLLPVPVFGANEWAIRGDVLRDEVIPIIERLGGEYTLSVVDLYTPLLNQGELFPDDVHPTAEGGLLIAQQLVAPLEAAAKARGFQLADEEQLGVTFLQGAKHEVGPFELQEGSL